MNIFWNIEDHEYVAGLSDSNLVDRFDWILRDVVAVRLYIVTPSAVDQTYTPASAPAGFEPRFALKKSGELDNDPLAASADWAQTLDADGKVCYDGTIDLNTALLIAAVGTATELDLIGEFTLQDAAGLNRDSSQVTVRIKPDVNRAGEQAPAGGSSLYGTLDARYVQVHEDQAFIQRKNKLDYIYIAGSGLWYPIVGTIEDGIPKLTLGEGVSL